ncbi:hypothetical protein QJS10_CPB13g01489 [Acorus calamus]|uniref:Nuclear speckle splicing regulatory protein 1 N-terminal domain-containing protein n=1 Tax=Acorus calamus TaxID=4465 RepID=A0AAV9DHZ1_ACOCL|nr:hypothetical protein QJS10_CPB13g01489 [Acorus calamus]
MKKYGLQLRPSHQKKPSSAPTTKPIRPSPAAFMDEDEDDVEMEIARQAAKNRALKDIENQHKKALEEDPSVFDYDGVYDEMKEKIAKPLIEDRKEKKPKYIQLMIEKAKERKIQDEIVYERKIQKERSKEDDLFANKDKYVTSAYKKKLAEWQKWNEEEKMREAREKKDEDISSFYFNIGKNVAFGGKSTEPKLPKKHGGDSDDTRKSDNYHKPEEKASSSNAEATEQPKASVREDDGSLPSISTSSGVGTSSASDVQENVLTEKPVIDEKPKQDNHKKSEDDLAAARERYLARKRAREQNYE